MDILSVIVKKTKKQVALKKKNKPLENLLDSYHKAKRNFKSIFRKGSISIIAEIKRSSPSEGIIRDKLDPVHIARLYESSGVDAISVVTNQEFFGGSSDFIPIVKTAINLPLLRKDFIIDEYQIHESLALGADAILIIARILSREELSRFTKLTLKLGMTPIVEVHTVDDIKKALNTETKIIGINNRNLENFKVDLNVSLKLKSYIPDGYYTISESGIKNRRDITMLLRMGFDGALVGTSLLRATDIAKKIKELKWKT